MTYGKLNDMISQEVIISILTVVVPAIVAVAGIIIAWQTEKLRTMREQLSEKKYNAYADAVKMFYSILKDSKAHRITNNDEMMDRMIDIKRDIFMYGSDKVFEAFNKWLLEARENNDRADGRFYLYRQSDAYGGRAPRCPASGDRQARITKPQNKVHFIQCQWDMLYILQYPRAE